MARPESRHIVHVIPVLRAGGAENQLAALAQAQSERGDRVEILTLRASARLTDMLTAVGCTVVSARHRRLDAARASWRCRRADVVHAWMYHGFLLASLLRPFASAKHVWSVRRTDPRSDGLSTSTRAVIAACRRLAPRAPHALLYCSHAAQAAHRDAGFSHRCERVVHNAVPNRFFDHDDRSPADTDAAPAIGCLTRWSHDKGIDVLLRAWNRYVELGGTGTLVLGGPAIDESNVDLRALIESTASPARIRLVGALDDPSSLYRQLDIYVSPSRTEGFPNVVAEAMAARLPVIATDVGGTREVLGDAGVLVPSEDHETLAHELLRLDRDPEARARLGQRSFERCRREFTIESTVQATDELYLAIGA